MRITPKFILVFLLLFTTPCFIYAANDADGFTKLKNRLSLAKNMVLSWEREGKAIRLILEKNDPGFATFGLGTISEEGIATSGDLFQIEKEITNEKFIGLDVKHCFIDPDVQHGTILCDKKTEDFLVVNQKGDNNSFKVELLRMMKGNPDKSSVSFQFGHNNIIFTEGATNMAKYDPKSKFSEKVMDLKKVKAKQFLAYHKHGLVYLWSIVADILIIISAFFKHYNKYFEVHAWIFAFVGVYTFIFCYFFPKNSFELPGFLCFYVFEPTPSLAPKVGGFIDYVRRGTLHHQIGKFFQFAVLFMILGGFILRRSIVDPKVQKTGGMDKTSLRYFHLSAGIVLWAVARFMIFTGSSAFFYYGKGSFLFSYVCVETIVIIIIYSALIISQNIRIKTKKINLESQPNLHNNLSEEQNEIIDKLRGGVSAKRLREEHPEKTIMMYKNRIYDLTGIVHPGGNWIYEKANWREVSRFLNGVSGLERQNSRAWAHSFNAFLLLEKNFIGNLLDFDPNDNEWILREKNQGEVIESNDNWIIEQKIPISSQFSIIHFNHPYFRVKIDNKGIKWFGKHFLITDSSTGKSRTYTTCLSVTRAAQDYKQSLLEAFNDLIENGSTTALTFLPQYAHSLPFVVKDYKTPDALSSKLHSSYLEHNYYLEGPFGRGFNIPKDLSGKVAILSAGTGILPFVDFLFFLLKKSIYKVLKTRDLDTSIVKPTQNYSDFYEYTEFVLFASFKNYNDFKHFNWIEKLWSINKEYDLGIFDMVLRFSNESEEPNFEYPVSKKRILGNVIEENVNPNNVKKWLVCGPPKMMEEIGEDLARLGVADEEVEYV